MAWKKETISQAAQVLPQKATCSSLIALFQLTLTPLVPIAPNQMTSKLIWDIFLIDIIKVRVRLVPLLSLTALSWSCRRFIAWGLPNEVIAPYDLVVLLMLALKTPPIAGNCFSGWLTITNEGFSDLFFFWNCNTSSQFDKSNIVH